jgi:hypothetical protein
LVTTAVRRERGSGCDVNAIAMSNSSSMEVARSTPACASRASTACSLAASAPVCDDAARAPTVERPDFSTTIGFRFAMRDAISRNRMGLPKFSTYSRIVSIPGSSSHCSSRSLPLTSGLLPTDTNCAIPMPYSFA